MTRSVSASGAATVLILLSGCSHKIGNDRSTASDPSASGAAEISDSALPVAGAYGFTKGQAKTRLEASGYNSISGWKRTRAEMVRHSAKGWCAGQRPIVRRAVNPSSRKDNAHDGNNHTTLR